MELTGIYRHLNHLAWLLIGLMLVNVVLARFGYDIFGMQLFQTTLSFLLVPMAYFAGIAGVLILLGLARALMGGNMDWCGCHSFEFMGGCHCNGKSKGGCKC